MKKTVLIVDDSEIDRYIATRFIEKSGLFDHVYSLNDGEEAYDHFKNEEESKKEKGDFFPPTIVFLDINMPRMNGFEFLEKLNQLPTAAKHKILFVTMLTSSEDQVEKQAAMNFPFVETFLTKPFKKEYVKLLAEKVDQKRKERNE